MISEKQPEKKPIEIGEFIEKLKEKIRHLKTCSTIDVMTENINVSNFVIEHEQLIEKLLAKIERIKKLVKENASHDKLKKELGMYD